MAKPSPVPLRLVLKTGSKTFPRSSRGLPLAQVDRDQLSQAFLNLLINSLEAMEEGGKVRVGIRREGQDSLKISIGDTGKGIPGEDLEKVFEPFFSTKRKGTGLGLAIVHQIVEGHGGDIQVESQEGEGTSFQITLPIGPTNRLGAE